MPLLIPEHFPALGLLEKEKLVLPEIMQKDVQVRIAILNLMPMKVSAEADYIRLLANSPLNVEIRWMKLRSHTSKNAPKEHMETYYEFFDKLKDEHFDGLIVTGAPLEHLDFSVVDYWNELTEVFDWAHGHVKSTLYICWAAQAALYHFYHVPKYLLPKKMFGIFPHHLLIKGLPIFQGFDDEFFVPHSRHAEVRREDILKADGLTLLAESEDSGVYMAMSGEGREFYVTGHSEYEPYRLDTEYKRDLGKGLPIEIPMHYYRDDDPKNEPVVRWRAHSSLLFTNWLNYYVFQHIHLKP